MCDMCSVCMLPRICIQIRVYMCVPFIGVYVCLLIQHVCVRVCVSFISYNAYMCVYAFACVIHYGVATISRLFKIIGLFCKRAQ